MMSSIFLAGLALAAAAGSSGDMSHRVTIQHQGQPVEVTYRAIVDVDARQLGAAIPTRVTDTRCTWVANVTVERTTSQAGQPVRTISQAPAIDGRRHGDCMTNRHAIGRDVAAREDEVRAHLVEVAEADRAAALAALGTATQLAFRD